MLGQLLFHIPRSVVIDPDDDLAVGVGRGQLVEHVIPRDARDLAGVALERLVHDQTGRVARLRLRLGVLALAHLQLDDFDQGGLAARGHVALAPVPRAGRDWHIVWHRDLGGEKYCYWLF